MTTKNFVKEAVQIAGGASRVAAQLKVSSRAVSTWQLQGFVPNYYRAEELAALANVPVSVLRKANRTDDANGNTPPTPTQRINTPET